MEKIYVTKMNRVNMCGTSKGNQMKWFKDNKFIKSNTWKWYEDVSEVLVSKLLHFSNVESLHYYPCEIIEDGRCVGGGCYSHNFLKQDEQDITFYRLAKSIGFNLNTATFDEVRDELSDFVGFDLKGYMGKCFCADAITFNEDRHFNNLSVIKSKNGYRESPVYDFGLSCLADIFSYPLEVSVHENLKGIYAKPFHTDFGRQLTDNRITPILLDKDAFLQSIHPVSENEKRALEVIRIGLEKWKGIAWEEF